MLFRLTVVIPEIIFGLIPRVSHQTLNHSFHDEDHPSITINRAHKQGPRDIRNNY